LAQNNVMLVVWRFDVAASFGNGIWHFAKPAPARPSRATDPLLRIQLPPPTPVARRSWWAGSSGPPPFAASQEPHEAPPQPARKDAIALVLLGVRQGDMSVSTRPLWLNLHSTPKVCAQVQPLIADVEQGRCPTRRW
jgi:hypothetical protein